MQRRQGKEPNLGGDTAQFSNCGPMKSFRQVLRVQKEKMRAWWDSEGHARPAVSGS
jgi:hypothetical protein